MVRIMQNMKSSGMILAISGLCCCIADMATGQFQDLEDDLHLYGNKQRPNKRTLAGGFGGGGGLGEFAGGTNGLGGGYDPHFIEIREAPPKRIEARQHGKIVLECSADGGPTPHIIWLKDGRPFFKDGKKRMVKYLGGQDAPQIAQATGETKSKITLDCLGEEDAGLYECVASNGHSKVVEATRVSVASFHSAKRAKEPFLGDAGWAADGAEPTIHQWTDTYTQMVGQDALLLCRAGGNHETFWSFEPMMAPDRRKPLDLKSEKYQMTATGDLVVRNLVYEDMGHFICTVRNVNGEDTVRALVYPLAVR